MEERTDSKRSMWDESPEATAEEGGGGNVEGEHEGGYYSQPIYAQPHSQVGVSPARLRAKGKVHPASGGGGGVGAARRPQQQRM